MVLLRGRGVEFGKGIYGGLGFKNLNKKALF